MTSASPRHSGKRALDVSLAGFGHGIVATGLALAAIIKFEDGGPVFSQDRAGEGGRVLQSVQILIDDSQCGGCRRCVAEQPSTIRVTRIGRLMRATAMDEFPNLEHLQGT